MDFIYKSRLSYKTNKLFLFCKSSNNSLITTQHYTPEVIFLIKSSGSTIFVEDINNKPRPIYLNNVDSSLFAELHSSWDRNLVNCYLTLHNDLFNWKGSYHLNGIKSLYKFICDVMTMNTNEVISHMRQYDYSSKTLHFNIKQLGLAYKNIDPILHDYFLNLFHSNRYALSTVSPH